MVQILPKTESFGSQFGKAIGYGAGTGINQGIEEIQNRSILSQENQALNRLYGKDFSGIRDPELRNSALASMLKGEENSINLSTQQKSMQDLQSLKHQHALEEQREKYDLLTKANQPEILRQEQEAERKEQEAERQEQEKFSPFESGLETVKRLRTLRKKGNLGIGSSHSLFPKTQKDVGEYTQLAKSLIQLSTNIPIRNQIEFETLAGDLINPNITDAHAEGTLNAIEKILKGYLNTRKNSGRGQEVGQGQNVRNPNQMNQPTEKRSLDSLINKPTEKRSLDSFMDG